MKIKLYYFYNGASYASDSERIEASTIDWRGGCPGYRVFIKEEEVEVPDCAMPAKSEITNGIVATLKEKKATILAETHTEISRIDDEIHQLSALEYSGE